MDIQYDITYYEYSKWSLFDDDIAMGGDHAHGWAVLTGTEYLSDMYGLTRKYYRTLQYLYIIFIPIMTAISAMGKSILMQYGLQMASGPIWRYLVDG